MNTLGIVAEYNPFHNGHEYQIYHAKKTLGAQRVVVLMSGNFTQRGIPAICDKKYRAKAAIEAGADLVLEMPVSVATADTPLFAQGAVDILIENKCDAILFGSESGNLSQLKEVAIQMTTDKYWDLYESNMYIRGLKPDDARISALRELVCETRDWSFVNSSNNLLGIYYISAAIRRNSDIQFYTNKRIGQDYMDENYTLGYKYASASAIRKELYDLTANIDRTSASKAVLKTFQDKIPGYMLEYLIECCENNNLYFIQHLEKEIAHSFQVSEIEKLIKICQIIPAEALKELQETGADYGNIKKTFIAYTTELKTDRMLCWTLLGMPQPSMKEFLMDNHIGWRVLNSRAEKYQDRRTLEMNNHWDKVDAIIVKIKKAGIHDD